MFEQRENALTRGHLGATSRTRDVQGQTRTAESGVRCSVQNIDKIPNVFELAIDTREPHIRYLIEPRQERHHDFAQILAVDFGIMRRKHFLFDFIDQNHNLLVTHRSLPACPLQTRTDFLRQERLSDTSFFTTLRSNSAGRS